MGFRDQSVVVTGAAAGIGRCIAGTYAEKGAIVYLLDRNAEGVEALSQSIHDTGGRAIAIPCDVSRPRQIDEAFSYIDRVDILVNNAGLGVNKPMFALKVEEWDDVLNTNLRGAFLCSRAAALKMPEGGRIVNIASTRGMMSEADTEAYSASKGGILALTHAMAQSLSSRKIRVNAISPGWIETGDYAALRPEDHSQHPSGRVGRPEDIARACLYLTDEGNDFITGQNFVIDGGMTTKMIYIPD